MSLGDPGGVSYGAFLSCFHFLLTSPLFCNTRQLISYSLGSPDEIVNQPNDFHRTRKSPFSFIYQNLED